jgi:hypothetical protein
MPVHIQQTTNTLNTAFLLQIQDKALEFISHARIVFSKPGDDLQNPVFWTLNPGKTNMNEGRHLTHIKMPEFPLSHVVIYGTQPLTFGTGESESLRMVNIYVHPMLLFGEDNLRDKPGAFDPKELREKCGLFHRTPKVTLLTEVNTYSGRRPLPRYSCVSPSASWLASFNRKKPMAKNNNTIPHIGVTHTNVRCGIF